MWRICLFLGCGALLVWADTPTKKVAAPMAFYHGEADHLWNRIHAVFHVRTGPDGKTYGVDRLEPLLWNGSRLPDEKAAVAILEEFLRDKGETLVTDPLRRALLQRDLWFVFSWLAKVTDDQHRLSVSARQLGELLAAVLKRLALTPEERAKLPDNYALAIASKKFAPTYDDAKSETPFLPPDLFKDDGPWVQLGRTDGPTGLFHVDSRGTNHFANSAFFLFVQLPGGREKTLAYVKELTTFKKPLLVYNRNNGQTTLTPDAPQVPAGTQFALVRKAALLDANGKLVPSPLTESVQIRVLRTPPIDVAKFKQDMFGMAYHLKQQALFEFQISAQDLQSERPAGLRDTTLLEDFKTGFNSHGYDVIELIDPKKPMPNGRVVTRVNCVGCHHLPNIFSFNSNQHFARSTDAEEEMPADPRPPFPLAPMKTDAVWQAFIEYKERDNRVRALRKVWPKE